MTERQAYARARTLAQKTGEQHYVVYESGEYHVANEFDMDTFFAGNHDYQAVYPR